MYAYKAKSRLTIIVWALHLRFQNHIATVNIPINSILSDLSNEVLSNIVVLVKVLAFGQ